MNLDTDILLLLGTDYADNTVLRNPCLIYDSATVVTV